MGPLQGVKVVEMAGIGPISFAGMMLADLGAEVTKIEPPGGDISRQVSDSYFASLNRGKRSICLELATDAGQRRLGELVAESHALLVNLKPSGIHRLGLTYAALRQHNVLVQPGYFYDFERSGYLVLSLLTPPDIFDEALNRARSDFSR